jgi:uncharacterized protein YecT (DUF1311 family)
MQYVRFALVAATIVAFNSHSSSGAEVACDWDDPINESCACKNAPNELSLNFCLDAKRRESDKLLNAIYRQLLANLSADSQKYLRASQRMWVQFRDAECEYATRGIVQNGGNANAVNVHHSICLDDLTKMRVVQLREHLACTQNGCPN